jgi:hypothetical protein
VLHPRLEDLIFTGIPNFKFFSALLKRLESRHGPMQDSAEIVDNWRYALAGQ